MSDSFSKIIPIFSKPAIKEIRELLNTLHDICKERLNQEI